MLYTLVGLLAPLRSVIKYMGRLYFTKVILPEVFQSLTREFNCIINFPSILYGKPNLTGGN